MIAELPRTRLGVPGMVIIPAKDESASVGDVVRDVRDRVDCEVVVVDDASVDDTGSRAQAAGAKVLRMPFRVGAWGAVQAGMAYALAAGCQVALTMDADGQHPASAVKAVSAPVVSGETDLAIGVCPERASRARHVAWSVFRSMTGLNIQDVTSGMRAYNERAMRVLTSREAAMLSYQDVGVLLMLREAGLQATEVRIEMQDRLNGHSRVYDSWWTVARYLTETFVLSAGKWRPSWHNDDLFVTSNGSGGNR
ncbi:MAG: glycosyltransferase [Gammaproteobacteria bacterium]|nr:glycosyltransferase [Gammaproteobacteria bacterium]